MIITHNKIGNSIELLCWVCNMTSEKQCFVTFLARKWEINRVNEAWKKSECMNRSEWLKKAINAYAGEEIFS